MRRIVSLVAVVALVLVAVGAWAFWPRGGTPTTKEAAVATFREGRGTEQSNASTEAKGAPARSVLPAPGVYTYAASGDESVKFGPLPAESRVHADPVVATIVASSKDCVDFQLALFAEHTESTTFCSSGNGIAVTAHTMSMKVGAIPASPELSCDEPLEIQPGAAASGDEACKLELNGGPATVSADVVGKTEVGSPTKIDIDGSEVEVLPVTVSYVASGKVAGPWIERIWFSTTDWMPVKAEREIALVGPATINENSTLQLTSLEPAT